MLLLAGDEGANCWESVRGGGSGRWMRFELSDLWGACRGPTGREVMTGPYRCSGMAGAVRVERRVCVRRRWLCAGGGGYAAEVVVVVVVVVVDEM